MSAFIIVVNLSFTFSGRLNEVRAVLTSLPLTQVLLMWLTTILYGVVTGFLIAAPDFYCSPKVSADIRSWISRTTFFVILLAFFAFPLWFAVAMLVLQIAFRALALSSNRSAAAVHMTFRPWLVSETAPIDCHLNDSWRAGRAVLQESLGTTNAAGPLTRDLAETIDLHANKVISRQTELKDGLQLSSITDTAVAVGLRVLQVYFVTWLIFPIPLGPRYQLELESGNQVVGYRLEGPDDLVLIVPEEDRGILTVRSDQLRAQRVCGSDPSLLTSSALDLLPDRNGQRNVIQPIDCSD